MLLAEQILNGAQFGIMLFLLAAGLTLVFGIMGLINLAHGSLYMIGAFAAAWAGDRTGSFLAALVAGTMAAAIIGMIVEAAVLRRLYARDHLDQVVATFGLILFFNEAATMLFGRQPLFARMPPWLAGSVELLPGVPYPAYRLAIIAVGLLVALGLYLLVARTRLGMLIRAGNSDREMVRALGVDIGLVYTLVFGLGALLAGLAGVMAGPVFSVQVGMGEQVLILTFVVIIIGGIGSVRGAFIGALLVGMVDTLTRAFLPGLLKTLLSTSDADAVGGGVSSMAVYLLMAAILLWRPRGLFPAHG
ncbi:MAG TPA: branched-chain amino acid ABC transporter permease [Aliidongia sp.]|uniref:branched-chain amino acid ABC transporter permease n=1 Tax=Aliidongia sp. TaxID=1914230 RepID=UPI002DDD290C|nr:branched-chain amino acid ABC transporter permease [Aliidongia sp.]HEV2676763.1 branched-chain amino acid ABC transporter permease [Aliidongia sp.]